MDFKEQHILFLKGISITDIVEIEDIFDKQILDNINSNSVNNTIIYDKIPKLFNSINEWIKTTNIRCWNCSLKFKNIPWFIIENANYTANGVVYDIRGNFCSVGCLQGYINVHYDKRKDFDIYNFVKKLYKIIYNRQINEIAVSPSKYNLKIYGGELDINEYQNEIKKMNDINIKNSYHL